MGPASRSSGLTSILAGYCLRTGPSMAFVYRITPSDNPPRSPAGSHHALDQCRASSITRVGRS